MKNVLFVFVMLLSVSIASAKGPKFLGSWMSEKIVDKEGAHMMFMPITFEDDNDMITGEMVFGIWHYDKKTKIINIHSFRTNEFNGDWEIKSLNKEELILQNDDFEWHFFKYDKAVIKKQNQALNLTGTWHMTSKTEIDNGNSQEEAAEAAVEEEVVEEVAEEVAEEAVEEATEEVNEESGAGANEEYYEEEYTEPKTEVYYTFDSDNMSYSVQEIQKGYSSKSGGEWMYKPKQKSILFIAGRRASINGDAKSIKINDNTFSFENNGTTYVFNKLKTVDVELLSFDYNYLSQNRNEDSYPPWGQFDKLCEQMRSTKTLVYKKGVYNSSLKIFDYSSIVYKAQVEEGYEVAISEYSVSESDTTKENEITIGEDYGSENEFFPIQSLDNYIVMAKETITVPAGTFECTVVIGFGHDDVKYKLWMIDAKTGAYAKIISQKEDYRNNVEYTVLELQVLK